MQAATKQWLFWRANPHQWGAGKIHLVDEEGRQKTLCGKALETCPGRYVDEAAWQAARLVEALHCQGCLNALRALEKRIALEAEWRERQLALRLEREEKDQAWQEKYAAYMDSPEWRRKRRLVLQRENNLCQACREYRATQVHHLTYKHVFHEPLFELVAICKDCHERITALDRGEEL